MDTYKNRAAEEYRQLYRRIEKLDAFLKRDKIEETIGEKQFDLLHKQLDAMRDYLDALGARLEDFNFTIEDVLKYHEPALSREMIFNKACDDCLIEMYEKAQPPESYTALCTEYEHGKIGKEDRVYDRYYLSREEYNYIKDKYKEAYNIKAKWYDNMDLLLKNLEEGGLRDGYREDDNGLGHRTAEKIPPLTELIGEEHANIVLQTIRDIKNFYRFDREENGFEWFIGLGSASPTCNKESVIKYWKEKGIDIVIEDRDPDKFWEIDEYGEELEYEKEDEESE